jgi:hypothetical protein
MTNPVMQTQLPSPQPPSGAVSPKTTEVMVVLTAKQGISRDQIMKVMPAEIRATVKLYLDGKIRQWGGLDVKGGDSKARESNSRRLGLPGCW